MSIFRLLAFLKMSIKFPVLHTTEYLQKRSMTRSMAFLNTVPFCNMKVESELITS
jgi:hypothetical protein